MQTRQVPRQVAVIDDDLFTRAGAELVFSRHPAVAEPSVHTLESAQRFGPEYWRRFDALVIDIHDHAKEVAEVGTDVYTGVSIILSIRSRGIDCGSWPSHPRDPIHCSPNG